MSRSALTLGIERGFAALKEVHGAGAIERVEAMVASGRRDRHPLQKGARWVMPGITSKPWHDRHEHASLRALVTQLETLHPLLKSEIATLLRGVRSQPLEPYAHYTGEYPGWNALYLFRDGQPVTASRDLLPVSFAAMEQALSCGLLCPLLEMHYSVLCPGARIAPHCDLWNFTLNLHLAVDIPPGCGIRVAGVPREWEEGRCLLFDYSYMHEARNGGDRNRVCLLADLWHPDVTLAEREALVLFIGEIRRLLRASS